MKLKYHTLLSNVALNCNLRQYSKAGPVALITVWGSVPEKVRRGIIDALDNSGIEDGQGEEDRGVQSWWGGAG